MKEHSFSIYNAYTTGDNDHYVWKLVLIAGFGLLLLLANDFAASADFPAASLFSRFIRTSTARAALLDAQGLYEMAREGQSEGALRFVAAYADRVGRWGPAPGDTIIFDPYLPWRYRGANAVIDDPRAECHDQGLGGPHLDIGGCIAIHETVENQVRFGRAMFATRAADGTSQPRPTFDDILATYIEEVGHSWQEYYYETEGLGAGERTRATSAAAAHQEMRGREYQIKTYILNLDGKLLWLSEQMRAVLLAEICRTHAAPAGSIVPPFGPPPGWPVPEAWPTSAPPTGTVRAYCRYMDERI